MLLVIDIGNTNIVLGVFEGETLKHSWRAATRRDRTADEYAALCRNFFQSAGLEGSDFSAMVISSVVPPLNEYFEEMADKYFNLRPRFVEPDKQRLIPVRYNPVSDVGADRVVTAVAAVDMVGAPAIVVDFGTATTFDAISKEGDYLGGIIATGIGVSAEALFMRASRLPRVEIRKPPRIIGDSTVTSIQSGLYFGYVALVEGILERMKRELGPAGVIATGGFAKTIAKETTSIDRVEENLMLYGLRIFHERSAGF